MNELLKRLFSTYADATTRTLLGRASDQTLHAMEEVVLTMANDQVGDAKDVKLEDFKRLLDKDFKTACVRLATMCFALHAEEIPTPGEVAAKYDVLVSKLGSPMTTNYHWHMAYLCVDAANEGNITPLEDLIISGESDDALPDVLTYISANGGLRFELDALSSMAKSLLASLVLQHTLYK